MIFILGGDGFLGSAFTRFCKKTDQKYIIINRKNYQEYKNKSCDILINVAGSADTLQSARNPLQDFDVNVKSVRDSLLDFNYQKYVFLSTCLVYPDCSSKNLTQEDSIIDFDKQSHYAFHKLLAEFCVRHEAKNWLIFRLGNMVGKGLKKNPIFDIITGDKLWISPKSELQIINTDDVSEIIFDLLNQEIENQIFNLCGQGQIILDDLIRDKQIKIEPNSPISKFDVNIEKILNYKKIPKTKETVLKFLEIS